MLNNIQNQISELIQEELDRRHSELFSVRMFRSGRRQVVSLLIDHCDGGITLDECAEWNELIGDLIERSQLIDGPHVVEVSSPGVNWPLASERDFRRVLGKAIAFRYRKDDGLMQDTVGCVREVRPGMLFLQEEGHGDLTRLPLERVVQAKPHLVI